MPRHRIHLLLSVAFGLTVAGCGGGTTDPATGTLALAVSGLPAGVAADIDVSGPNGYHRQVGAAETLAGLALGTYTLVAAGVSADGTGYAASPPSQSVTVSDGDAAGAAVAYTPLIPGTGSLAVAVDGLPGGTDAAVTVSGPGGYIASGRGHGDADRSFGGPIHAHRAAGDRRDRSVLACSHEPDRHGRRRRSRPPRR